MICSEASLAVVRLGLGPLRTMRLWLRLRPASQEELGNDLGSYVRRLATDLC